MYVLRRKVVTIEHDQVTTRLQQPARRLQHVRIHRGDATAIGLCTKGTSAPSIRQQVKVGVDTYMTYGLGPDA